MRFGKWSSFLSSYNPELMMNSCTIEMSVVVSHLIWLLRTRGIRKRAKEAGETFDESAEGAAWQAKGINLEKKFFGLFRQKENGNLGGGAETLVEPEEIIPEEVTPKTVPNTVV
jgi:hypothetical protein